MIKVTRLNGTELFVNAEMIQFIEETPDTVVTLLNKDKIVVKESASEIVKRVIEYARTLRGFQGLTNA